MQSAVFRPHVRQISPDKNVICRYATAAFTVSPKPGALSCCADLPGDLALYAISVRRLIVCNRGWTLPGVALTYGEPFAALRLRTVPRETALVFG